MTSMGLRHSSTMILNRASSRGGWPVAANRCQRHSDPGQCPREPRRIRPRLNPVQPSLVLAEFPVAHDSLISPHHAVDNDQVLRVGRHFVTSSHDAPVTTTVVPKIRRQSQAPAKFSASAEAIAHMRSACLTHRLTPAVMAGVNHIYAVRLRLRPWPSRGSR